jgi:hypothetical protein
MHNTLHAFKQDLNSGLPRQVQALVQQINGETQGKCVEESPATPSDSTASSQNNSRLLANVSQPGTWGNLNLQQPFYKTVAYGPNISPMGSGVQHRPVPDFLFPRTPAPNSYQLGTDRVNEGVMADGVREHIARTLREFRYTLKGHARTYQKPYLEYFDTIMYPRGFRIPDSLRFNGGDARTTHEHIGHFLAQVNDVGITDHKVSGCFHYHCQEWLSIGSHH